MIKIGKQKKKIYLLYNSKMHNVTINNNLIIANNLFVH